LPDETLPGESTISTSVPGSTTAPSAPPTSAAPTTEPERSSAGITPPEGFTDGWFSDPASIPQALLWGALLAGIAYGIYWLSRKVRRYWVGILAGAAPFVVALYFFYENVNRLLPPNL